LADIIPMRKGENSVPYWTTATPPPPNQEPVALASCVTPDYLKVMGIPLRHGRFFNERDRIGSEPVVVVDENLAEHAFAAKTQLASASGFRHGRHSGSGGGHSWPCAPVGVGCR